MTDAISPTRHNGHRKFTRRRERQLFYVMGKFAR